MNNPFLFNFIASLLLTLSNIIGNTQPAIYPPGQKIVSSGALDSLLPPQSSMSVPDLTAKKGKSNSVSLEWSTENISLVKYLEIERSSDGRNFSKLGEWTPDNLKSKSSYTFLDQRPLPVGHYRVKLIYQDGNYNYSKVVVINQNGAFNLAIQPNPFVQSFTVDVNETDAQTIKIQVLDMNGRLLRYKSVAGKAGNNKIEFDDVGSLQPGIYMVRIVRGHSITEKKIVKNN